MERLLTPDFEIQYDYPMGRWASVKVGTSRWVRVSMDNLRLLHDGHGNWFKWHISNGYVARAVWDSENKAKSIVYLHRLIAGAEGKDRVYFKNGDKLDCRAENLTKVSPKTSSEIPGISWDKLQNKWK